MRIIRSPKQMSEICRQLKRKGFSIGFVPTMGVLHEGHFSLVREALRENNRVVVSIFVNSLQFAPREDFLRYPRALKKDAAACRKEKVDFIFYPSVEQMYAQGFKTRVTVADLGDVLCGKSRPGHFQGVATVVLKLFNIVQPDKAYFGQKDAQQGLVIRRMAKDLNVPVGIKIMPIVRHCDGLAMSSRNQYLGPEERKDAAVLYLALKKAKDLIGRGIRDSRSIIKEIKRLIADKKPRKIDYISIVNLDNLEPLGIIKDKALLALAVWFGKTRLIDNIILKGQDARQ